MWVSALSTGRVGTVNLHLRVLGGASRALGGCLARANFPVQDKVWKTGGNFPSNASEGPRVQGASVAMDRKRGAVRAIVGGRGQHVFRGYNRATQMKRQRGSTMKPLAVYSPALQSGYHYDCELSNKLQKFGKNGYEPKNVDNQYSNKIPMYEALAQSKNVPAVWLLDKIGVSKGVQSVENFGIHVNKSDQNLALALGGLSTGFLQCRWRELTALLLMKETCQISLTVLLKLLMLAGM